MTQQEENTLMLQKTQVQFVAPMSGDVQLQTLMLQAPSSTCIHMRMPLPPQLDIISKMIQLICFKEVLKETT